MKWAKTVLIVCLFSLIFSACTPISEQIEDLIEESLPGRGEERDPVGETKEGQNTLSDGLVHGFGMGSSTHIRVEIEHLSAAYAEMKNMGVQFIREEFPMADMQSGIDRFDFSPREGWDFDQMVALANQYDLEIVALLCYGPDEPYSSNEEFFSLWSNYVETIVRRYGDDIDYWEIGNEMNLWNFWGMVRPNHNSQSTEVDIYAEMLEISYKIIKDVDPDDTVIMGGLANTDSPIHDIDPLSYVHQISEYSDSRYYDAVALHTYWRSNMPEAVQNTMWMSELIEISMVDYVSQFSRGVQELNNEPIPIWLTEIGYDDDHCAELSAVYNIPPENIQAIALARVYTALLSIPNVNAVFWYTYENDDTGQRYEIKQISKDFYRSLSEALVNTIPLGRYPILDQSGQPLEDCYEYRFLKPYGDTVSVYWKNMSEVDLIHATVEDLVESTALSYSIEVGMYVYGVVVEESLTELMIIEKPGILIGAMYEETRLVVKGETTKTADLRKGQIAYIENGNVFYQNLETGEVQQLTHDADWEKDYLHVYTRVSFSPSGRYLAFEYGYSSDRTNRMILYDVTDMRKLLDEPHQMLIGWRHEEDTLLFGHNSEFCAPPDEWGESTTNEVDISFIVYAFNLETGRSFELIQIPNGYRLPIGMTSNHDYMVFQQCSCGNSECSWVREVFTEQGQLISPDLTLSTHFSNDLNYYIPISYNFHGPESAPLEVVDRETQDSKAIYYQEGKFPTSARWSPGDEWIVFWLGDVETWNYGSNLLVIHQDTSTVGEITPTPVMTLGWFPDDRLILLSNSLDRIDLYDLEMGEREILAELDENLNFSDIDWSTLPD